MITSKIEQLFAKRGASAYGGEVVTQLEHALQCATLAEQSHADTSLIVAALVHDIGHLLHDLPNHAPNEGTNDWHEERGFAFLQTHFPANISEPVRLHVVAKRYLCSVDQSYYDQLSEPSRTSLKLQGGTMSDSELEEFRSSPYWEAAVELRRWDDIAKVAGLQTPPLAHFLPLIEQVAILS